MRSNNRKHLRHDYPNRTLYILLKHDRKAYTNLFGLFDKEQRKEKEKELKALFSILNG
jgi:hypothetical protein